MAGFGRFKLTDALPEPRAEMNHPGVTAGAAQAVSQRRGKGKSKGKASRPAPRASRRDSGLAAEQVREARENNQAKNAEASTRDRMVDIGRGNQQAGRQRTMNGISDFRGEARGSRSGGQRGGGLWGGAGIGAAIAQAFAAEGRPGRGHRPRPAASVSWPPDSRSLWPGGRRHRLCRSPPGSPGSRAPLRPMRPRRLRRRRRLGQIRLSVLEARAGRLGARAEDQPDRRGERGTRVRPGDGRAPSASRRRQRDAGLALDALSLFGRRPDRLADRPSL